MSLPPEKISELKQIIHSQLGRMDLKSQIREVLNEQMSKDDDLSSRGTIGEEEVLEALKERGLIEEIMRNLHFETELYSPELPALVGEAPTKNATHFVDPQEKLLRAGSVKKANVDPTRRYLFLQIIGGKAFIEHLQDDPYPGLSKPLFTVHILFRGQRFKSRPVPCACEPDIQEGFLLELHKENAGETAKMADTASMLSISDQVHIVLVRTEPSGEHTLVSSHYLEWRPVLAAPGCRTNIAVELMGVGSEASVPAGVLDVRLELLPRPSESQSLTDHVVKTQVTLERNRQAERERLFLVYAKQWWKEYLEIRSCHRERLIKIFAQDENGRNRPVCSYVYPLRAGRLINTPREASRFVSLLGYEKTANLGGGERREQWASMHAFLCRNKGDCEDHAVLLCSLLLGFGLDAYCCVGTKTKGASHTWVMTINTDGLVTFWESLTGHRYIHKPIDPDDAPMSKQTKPSHPYRTVGCVFNQESFFANCQAVDSVETSVFDLYDQSRWKQMSEDTIRSVCTLGSMPTWPTIPPLCANPLDASLASNDLEQQLRALVTEHRRDQGLGTTWDDHLSYLLTPALAAYESERVWGLTAGNEEFQQAIRRAVPDGHTFKGYPVQFVHRNARKAFSACLKSPVCEEIVNCRGDHVRLGVRVCVYTYPEQASAVWMMFACKYKSVA